MEKTFTVDWDSIEDIMQVSRQFNSRIHHLKHSVGINKSRFEIEKERYNAIHEIMESDISYLYNDLDLDENKKYYVYAHLNTLKPIIINKNRLNSFASFTATLGLSYSPFYIGKGCGDRFNNTTRNETHRKIKQYLETQNKKIEVSIIKDNLTEKDALILESKLIDIYGLDIYNGSLTNLDEGVRVVERRHYYGNAYNLITSKRMSSLRFNKIENN